MFPKNTCKNLFPFLFFRVEDIIKEYGANYIIAFNTVGGKLEDSEIKADPNVNVLRFFKKTAYAFVRQLGLANPSFEDVYNQLALTQTRMYAAVSPKCTESIWMCREKCHYQSHFYRGLRQ